MKSGKSLGIASLTTCERAELGVGERNGDHSPTSRSIVAVRVTRLTELPLSGSLITRFVRSQPASALANHVRAGSVRLLKWSS